MSEKDDKKKDEQKESRDEFKKAVNMTAKQLEKWLDTDESKSVGQKKGGGESTGHEMGRTIVEILEKKVSDYDEDDFKHMTKVVGYVRRHLEQRPDGDVEETPWRYSLMNWGHDPTKSK